MSGRLTELLAAIDRPSALAFVEEQIGVVLVYDSEHGSDLTDQLEQALDELASQPLDELASQPLDRPTTTGPLPPGVMHALELLNADLDRPSDRLALHLALKLHRMHTGARVAAAEGWPVHEARHVLADERPQDRPRGMSRRRFGLAAVALGAVLSAAGAALADASGVAAAVGLAALAQGIGLLVAGAWLALGHNPLNRERR